VVEHSDEVVDQMEQDRSLHGAAVSRFWHHSYQVRLNRGSRIKQHHDLLLRIHARENIQIV